MLGKLADAIGSVFEWLWEQIKKPFDSLPSVVDYIFGTGGDDLIFRTFTSEEWNLAISPGINAFLVIATFIILTSILLIAMRTQATAFNPAHRTALLEGAKDLLIVSLVLINIDVLYNFLFSINELIITGAQAGFADMELSSTQEISESFDDELGVVAGIMIDLILLFITLWAMFYYTMRKFTLTVLMIVGPVVASLYLIPQTKGITIGWLKELTGTILVQGVHVAVFYILSVLTLASESGVEQIFYFLLFIPTGEVVKSLLGLETNTQGKMFSVAKMTGLGAGMGVAGAAKGALSGKNPARALNDLRQGKSDKKGQSGQATTPNASQKANVSQGKSASRMMTAGKIAGGASKFALGSAGAIAGAALGPMGSVGGMAAGGAIGNAVGGLGGRMMAPVGKATHKVGSYSKSSIQGGWKGAKGHAALTKQEGKGLVKQSLSGMKGSAIGVADGFKERRADGQARKDVNQLFGEGYDQNEDLKQAFNHRNRERKMGYVGGVIGGEKGYEMGQKLANKRMSPEKKEQLQKIQKTPSEIKGLAKKDSDGNIAPNSVNMVSTNEASYIEVTDSNNKKHITSKMGGGNLSLKRGQTQRLDMSQQMNNLSKQVPQAQISSDMVENAGTQTVQQNRTVQRDVVVKENVQYKDNIRQESAPKITRDMQKRVNKRTSNEINRPKNLT